MIGKILSVASMINLVTIGNFINFVEHQILIEHASRLLLCSAGVSLEILFRLSENALPLYRFRLYSLM